jgi:hypothetical protein
LQWLIKRGFFECENCGTKLTSEQVKELLHRVDVGEAIVVMRKGDVVGAQA